MRLTRALVAGAGPFERVEVLFADEELNPRELTVVHGSGGVGKSTLLQGIATTRPGNTVAQLPRGDARGEQHGPAHVVCDWLLSADDPDRPHVLRLASPNVRLPGDESEEGLRRREQAHFDKLAQEGGFAFLWLPAARWFSRQPFGINAPARAVGRYDVRSPISFEDSSRVDLARETKQALGYAAISAALSGAAGSDERRFDLFAEGMHAAVDRLCDLVGLRYAGVDPATFEPIFSQGRRHGLPFDALPTRARHLIAIGAMATRVLWAAYPDRDPREAEGVILVDDIELYQEHATLLRLGAALREALPVAQWVVTTASPVLAASSSVSEVVALRRGADDDIVTVFAGEEALTH
jgi:hypothetical protein